VLELHDWKGNRLTPSDTRELRFGDDSITYLARAIGAAHNGDAQQARGNVTEIESIYKQVVAKEASRFADWADQERQEAEAWADHARGQERRGSRTIAWGWQTSKKKEFSESLATLPAREMLADMLLEMNRPGDALAEYETQLKINPKSLQFPLRSWPLCRNGKAAR